MVLCKACDKYLELLDGNKNNSLTSDERKNERPVQQILEYLKNNDTITTMIGKKITGKSEAQVRRYLKALTDCGVIKSKKITKEKIYIKL